MSKNYVTNKTIYEAVGSLRTEMTHRIEKLEDKVDCNTSYIDNLEGKIAVGVITIGVFISAITAVFTSGLKKLFFKD